VNFAQGVSGKSGNDMSARKANESDEEGHSELEEHPTELSMFEVVG